MSKNHLPEPFNLSDSACFICKTNSNDTTEIIELLKHAIDMRAIRAICIINNGDPIDNYIRTDISDFFYGAGASVPIPIHRVEIYSINLLHYLDRLVNWLSGKGFSSHFDENVKSSLIVIEPLFGHPGHDELTQSCFTGGLKNYQHYLDNNKSFSDPKWQTIIKDAIDRLKSLQDGNTQDTNHEEEISSPKVESDKSDDIKTKENTFTISDTEGFQCVNWNREPFNFTEYEAKVIELLYKAYKDGTKWVSSKTILDMLGKLDNPLYQDKVSEVFASLNGKKAWNTLVLHQKTGKQGFYSLNI